jgi:hypothetical protein
LAALEARSSGRSIFVGIVYVIGLVTVRLLIHVLQPDWEGVRILVAVSNPPGGAGTSEVGSDTAEAEPNNT